MMSPVSLTYTKMQEMERYFLHFMNNGTGDLTEYWCFSVNEMDQTYMLRKRKALEQNEVGGSLVLNGENIIANAMSQAKFSEYTSGGECVATYEIKGERIDKNSMKGFWFQ